MTDTTHAASTPAGRARGRLWRLAPLALIAAALVAFFALGLHRYFTPEVLRANRDALNAFVADNLIASIALFMAVYAGAVAISFPGASILTIFGGFLFGAAIGLPGATAVTVVAATLGATAIFLAAKTALGDVLRERTGGALAKIQNGFEEGELSYMFVLRLVPAFPFFVINAAAGLLDVKLRNYLIATFFGIIPGTFVYTSIGSGAGAIWDAGEELTLSGVMTRPDILIPIVGLVVLALIPVAYKRFAGAGRDHGSA